MTYSREAVDNAGTLWARPFRELFYEFIHSYESDSVLLGCQALAEHFLGHDLLAPLLEGPRPSGLVGNARIGDLSAAPEPFRQAIREVHQAMGAAASTSRMDARERAAVVLLHRSPTGLTEPCWLDNVSQPATQPAKVVNDLFRIYAAGLGHGDVARSACAQFRKLCVRHDVFVPAATSIEFARHEKISDFAYVGPCFHLALSRHPRLFLPEIVGTTLAHYMLHMDPLSGEFDGERHLMQCREVIRSLEKLSFSPRWPALERRVLHGFRVEVDLEFYFWQRLGRYMRARSAETPHDRMCKLVQRVAKFAGDHHHGVLFEGRPLADWLAEAEHDARAFVTALGNSSYFDKANPANSKFFQVLSIDGPMFAIFSKEDGKIIKQWAQSLAAPQGDRADTAEEEPAVLRMADLLRKVDASGAPTRYAVHETARENVHHAVDLRELVHALINVDLHPYILPRARDFVRDVLSKAEPYLLDGRAAKYSDATFFDYTPAALEKRMEDVYFHKLIKDYRPISEMPPRELVVSMQKMLALGSLIDGAWIHKIGKVPQYGNQAAHLMFGIYADEMGYGDMRLNHVMVARRVLDSMDVELPEMADREYAYNDSVPEKCFAFLAYQMAISQFPRTFFAEGLGLNLAVEMFGLGQVRLDEIRKLRHYGFDDSYERLHLTIDNAFSGHVKVGVDAIHAYLDEIRTHLGPEGVDRVWRRIWRGYASMAPFVE